MPHVKAGGGDGNPQDEQRGRIRPYLETVEEKISGRYRNTINVVRLDVETAFPEK